MAELYVGTRLYDDFRIGSNKKKFVGTRITTFNYHIGIQEKLMIADLFWNYKMEEIHKEIGLMVKYLPEKVWNQTITED